MEGEIYVRVVRRDNARESGQRIALTREVNRFVLWRHTWSIDDDELIVVKHWPLADPREAIEFSVDYGRGLKWALDELENDPKPAVPA